MAALCDDRAMKRAALLVGLAVLLTPGRAELGQIHYEGVTLDEVLSSSTTVVVVRPGDPAMVQHTIDLGEGIEPFTYASLNYRVVEYLRPARRAEEGETLAVSGFDSGRFGLHVTYYVHGISKSPIEAIYEAKHPPGPSDDVILFLRRGVFQTFDPATGELSGPIDTYMPVVTGAVEGIAARPTLAPRAAEPCGCMDSLDITVGAPAVTDALREKVAAAIEARFPDQSALGWQIVDTRPQRGVR